VHPAEWFRRQHELARAPAGEQRCLHREDPHRGTRLGRGQVQRRPDEDIPEPLDGALRLALAQQEVCKCLVVVRGRIEPAQREQLPDEGTFAQRQVRVAREQDRTGRDVRPAAVLVHDRKAQAHAANGARLTDPLEESEVLREATERDVLSVVGRRRWIAVALRQRLHGAAERRPRFQQSDLVSRVQQLERGRAAREAAAHDRRLHRRSPSPTIRSFVSADRCGGPSNTSKPLASIRSSVAR
jgi:hypothetical protein